MSAPEERIPTPAELEAYSLGKLDPQRAGEVESHLADHPDSVKVVQAVADDELIGHLRGAGTLPSAQRPSLLLELAVEGVLPVVGGCAGALAGGPEGGLVGVAAGQLVEKGINFFGQRIVARWVEWLRRQPPATRVAALVELAELPPEEARREAAAALAHLAPQASPADLQATIDYLGAIPRSVQRSLLSDRAPGGKMLPLRLSLDDSVGLMQLLPADVPPYAVPTDLPGTDIRLEELVGTGGFGAVYRASGRSLQHLPLAIKFCLDRALLPALQQERANLERLMKAGGESWSSRLVRLYGYNLEHPTPYLVYEYVSGGDLVRWLATRQAETGGGLTPAEVLDLIIQVTEALAFAHQHGLVHRDLKPANVLMGDGTIKLADFGIGGLIARQAVQASRIGTMASSQLSPAEQASLFRGAGTPLYMSQEQRRGAAPDPRHDLYSLGVMWYQLLTGDVTREMTHGWARELDAKCAAPREQIELIERCVGWLEERPSTADELLVLLHGLQAADDKPVGKELVEPPLLPAAPTFAPSPRESDSFRHIRLVTRVKQLLEWHTAVRHHESSAPIAALVFLALLVGSVVGLIVGNGSRASLEPRGDMESLRREVEKRPSYMVKVEPKLDNRTPAEKAAEKAAEEAAAKKHRERMEKFQAAERQYNEERDRAAIFGVIGGVLTGVGVLAVFFWLGVRWRRNSLARAKQALAAKISELIAEFPLEVQSWGGEAVLRDLDLVRVLLPQVEGKQR